MLQLTNSIYSLAIKKRLDALYTSDVTTQAAFDFIKRHIPDGFAIFPLSCEDFVIYDSGNSKASSVLITASDLDRPDFDSWIIAYALDAASSSSSR